MIRYTPEQDEVMEHMMENDGILLVQAGAGSGKSFIAKQVTKELKPKKGLYTAFNKAIVEEGEERFKGTNMECKTFHALAWKYVQPKGAINELTYKCITENIEYRAKFSVIKAINMFFVSSSTDMYDFYEEYFSGDPAEETLRGLSEKYTERMVAGEIDPTFNFLLKYFHLMLISGDVEVEYDLVILDEINDVTAVALEIFRLIKAPKKLGLGETNQAIYQFLNLVDGFEELADFPQLKLTQSWRCSETIASRINNFMKAEVSTDFNFVGTDKPVRNGKTLFVTATNAKIIEEISARVQSNQSFTLLRKPADIFAATMAVATAAGGKEPYQKKYLFLVDEYKNYLEYRRHGESFLKYLIENVDDDEVVNAARLLIQFGQKGINLFTLYKKVKELKPDPYYTIATVFTSKGLEFETVYISDDLNNNISVIRDNGGIKTIDDLVIYRCYYVACSRAGANLLNATMLPKN
jgi:F-box protein 18 (helicase)